MVFFVCGMMIYMLGIRLARVLATLASAEQ